MTVDQDVLFTKKGPVGQILLNRPKALNALTREMCVDVRSQLLAWADDGAVGAVIIDGAGEKAFCAGGDVRRVADSAKSGTDDWWRFFHDEYRMNHAIAHFPKPYIAILNGITMGGGVGISIHGHFRIATEKTLFAMPETDLGLIPDVGGSYVLPRLPGKTGLYLALTGYRAKAADCLYLGLATHFIKEADLDAVKASLEKANGQLSVEMVRDLLDAAASDPGDAPLAARRQQIDTHFGKPDVGAILDSLEQDHSLWAQDTHADLLKKSPTSLKLAFETQKRGVSMDVDACLQMEYRVVRRIVGDGHDFAEGVRAILVDKDRDPKWKPNRLAGVDDSLIDAHFAELGEDELRFNAL